MRLSSVCSQSHVISSGNGDRTPKEDLGRGHTFLKGKHPEILPAQDFHLAVIQVRRPQRPTSVTQGLGACLVGSVVGPACSLVWPLRTSPTFLGAPGPPPSVISLQVTEGHRPPRKGRGRGASGIWLPSHRKDNSRTWIVQDGEFPDTATHDSNQTHVLAPPSTSTQFQPDSGRASLRGEKESQRAIRTLTMGSANLMWWMSGR